jgi:EmrB/QacA subfamily drug resistance transporter
MDIRAQVWRVGAIVVCGTIGTALSLSTVNVAFDALSRELHARIDTVQWVGTGYLLGLAAVISTTGWLLRHIGARRLYLTTLLLFTATSALCALADSIEQLIAFRVLQGVAGGATMPVGHMILVSVAGPERMGQVMSVLGVPMLLGPALGPVCGGLLIEELGWQWLFLMNVPLGFMGFALGLRWLPALTPQPAGRFDRLGFALVVLGAPALVYGLAQAGRAGSPLAAAALMPMLAGTGLLVLFVIHALRTTRPLLDVRLWHNSGFAACATIALLVSGAMFGWMFLIPLYFQVALGEDALTTGLLLVPQGLGTVVSMGVAGRLTDRIGGGHVALVGVTTVAAATIAFAFVGPGTPYWVLCLLLVVRGLGTGGSIMPALAAAYATLTARQVSDATPQIHMLQRIGGSIGMTFMAVVLTAHLQDIVPAAPSTDRLPATAAVLTTPFTETFAWAAGLAVLALVPAAALARIDIRRAVGAATARKIAATSEPPIV